MFDKDGVEIIDFLDDSLDLNNSIESDSLNSFANVNTFNLNSNTEYNSINNFNGGVNTSDINNVNSSLNTIEELSNMKKMLLIQKEYPTKQINYDYNNGVFVLSEPGCGNVYVNVINDVIIPFDINPSSNSDSLESESKSLSGHSKTLSTPIGRLFSDRESGFTNMLFFIFLAGLSIGVVFMVVLNFFIG